MNTPIYARRSLRTQPYECKFPWPEDCFVQCGGDYDVDIHGEQRHRDGFFEAFPRASSTGQDTYLRGSGTTVVDAELKAWNKFQRYLACPGHEWEHRDRIDDCGYCKHCGMFASDVLTPIYNCHTCGIPASSGRDVDGNYYCEEHYKALPDEALPEHALAVRRFLAEAHDAEPVTEEDIAAVITALASALDT